MPSLWFVVPAAGRESLARVCLQQLRRTCDALTAEGVEASAVVIADDRNLVIAQRLGFATVNRDNHFLARKFNDGIQLACDERFNPRPVDYVVPCGSDDWVDHRLFLQLPAADTILAFRRAAFVSEDGTTISSRNLDYPGGVGIRVYPREMLRRWGFRPADEDRKRACDTSILINVQRSYTSGGPTIRYADLHEFQIVDWKSRGQQLNSYRDIMVRHRHGGEAHDPFDALAGVYPAKALQEMRAHYRMTPARVLA